MSVKRRISSTPQSVFKIVVLFFCVLFGAGVLAGSLSAGRVLWEEMLLPGGVLGFLLWFAVSRKTVQMDERFLYVSVFRRVNQIPLDDIASVTEAIGMRDRAVTVHFRTETPFGRTITFTPTLVFGREPHPIVAELSRHAAKDEK
jgi:hypothetical protein